MPGSDLDITQVHPPLPAAAKVAEPHSGRSVRCHGRAAMDEHADRDGLQPCIPRAGSRRGGGQRVRQRQRAGKAWPALREGAWAER